MDEQEDTDWCEEAGMSYGLMRVLNQGLRMFLPGPFHDEYCDCYRCRPTITTPVENAAGTDEGRGEG